MCTTGALCGRRETDKNQGSLWGLTTSKLKPFIQSVSEPVTSPGVAVIVVELNVKMVHEMSDFPGLTQNFVRKIRASTVHAVCNYLYC